MTNLRSFPRRRQNGILTRRFHAKAGAAATIRDFRQLRKLGSEVSWPKPHEVLFSSVTSTELREIIFRAEHVRDWVTFERQMKAWVLVDEQSCGMVDRLRSTGHRCPLEVELRLSEIKGDAVKFDFTKFLPEFREKGVVTITNTVRSTQSLHPFAYYRQSRMGIYIAVRLNTLTIEYTPVWARSDPIIRLAVIHRVAGCSTVRSG